MQRHRGKRKAKILFSIFALFVFSFANDVWAVKVSEEMPIHQENAKDDGQEHDYEGIQEKSDASVSGKWKSRNQNIFYYENGKKVTGLKEINQKYYYFASNGIQRTGWQKYHGDFYFFKIANGKNGYMERSTTINGIRLTTDGKAKLTAVSTAKLDILIKANKILEKVVRPEMEKSEKLKKCFEYLLEHYQYRGSPTFVKTRHWELDYASDLFDKGHGNCYAFGAGFAFLANAAGYKNCYAVSSGGHGWAEVGGKVYDPTWSLIDNNHSYFAVSFDLSGRDGRPNYKNARTYITKI